MTNLTNYHSHCLYCDGRANMEDFIRFAISEGFSSYGISSHAPLPFSTAWTMEWDRMDDYLSEFSRLKGKYADKIELAIGLEIDYLNEESHPAIPRFQELPLDYRIGSVHMLYSHTTLCSFTSSGMSSDRKSVCATAKMTTSNFLSGKVDRTFKPYSRRTSSGRAQGSQIVTLIP